MEGIFEGSGPSWGRLGAVLEPSWGGLGAVLGRLGAVLGPLGRLLRPLGPLLGAFLANLKPLKAKKPKSQKSPKTIGFLRFLSLEGDLRGAKLRPRWAKLGSGSVFKPS